MVKFLNCSAGKLEMGNCDWGTAAGGLGLEDWNWKAGFGLDFTLIYGFEAGPETGQRRGLRLRLRLSLRLNLGLGLRLA